MIIAEFCLLKNHYICTCDMSIEYYCMFSLCHLEWHLVSPWRGGGFLLDVFDIGREDAHLEARRPRGQQAVVRVPVQRSHRRLDRLLQGSLNYRGNIPGGIF